MTADPLALFEAGTPGVTAWADFDTEHRHRYALGRRWEPGPLMLFVMLNPSTADERRLDPTTRRCEGFARREGFGGFEVVNLFSFIATDPAELRYRRLLTGPGWEDSMRCAVRRAGAVVCAWGASWRSLPSLAVNRAHVGQVTRMLREHADLDCLGTTAQGDPRHPLYLARDTPLESFDG